MSDHTSRLSFVADYFEPVANLPDPSEWPGNRSPKGFYKKDEEWNFGLADVGYCDYEAMSLYKALKETGGFLTIDAHEGLHPNVFAKITLASPYRDVTFTGKGDDFSSAVFDLGYEYVLFMKKNDYVRERIAQERASRYIRPSAESSSRTLERLLSERVGPKQGDRSTVHENDYVERGEDPGKRTAKGE